MEQFIRFCYGYVRILVRSNMPERFLRMCAHHGILLQNIVHRDNGYEMEVSIRDFRLLMPICRKSSTRVHILGKYGLPFFFYRNKKRKAFFVGIALCMALLLILSTKIWNIHIEGNYSYSTQSILEYLKKEEIIHGVEKKALNCSQIASSLRKAFPEIIWVSAKIKGTRLIIIIQENMDTYETVEKTETEGALDIVSEADGRIVEMITRKGVPLVQPGQMCKKGDLLVLGRLEILNDSKEVIRYEYVEADADIYLERTYQYYDTFPLSYETREYTGDETIQPFFQILDKRITFRGFQKKYRNFDRVCQEYPLKLTENYILPLSVGKIKDSAYKICKRSYTREEAKAKALTTLGKNIGTLTEKGVKISRNDVRITIDNQSCTTSGTLTVVEKMEKKVPTERLQVPQERISSDEQ